MLITPFLWTLFALSSLLSLKWQWLLVVAIAIALNFANLYGYIKCAKDARTKFSSFAKSYLTSTLIKNATNNFGSNTP